MTQQQANELIAKSKEATRIEILNWKCNTRYDESIIAVGEPDLQFILTLTRNLYEIKAHFRLKARDIYLARIDTQNQHFNPDGEKITGPHLHWYREGFELLPWAESIDWYDANKPIDTIFRFLDLINTRFPNGIQEVLL